MHGYRLEYSNNDVTWTCHTKYASHYDELRTPMELPYSRLVAFRHLIIKYNYL